MQRDKKDWHGVGWPQVGMLSQLQRFIVLSDCRCGLMNEWTNKLINDRKVV